MNDSDFTGLMASMDEVRRYGRGDRGKTITHEPIDVTAIRKKTNLTQPKFAVVYHLPVGTLRDWEQKRRSPDAPARTLLTLIDKDPEGVAKMLTQSDAA